MELWPPKAALGFRHGPGSPIHLSSLVPFSPSRLGGPMLSCRLTPLGRLDVRHTAGQRFKTPTRRVSGLSPPPLQRECLGDTLHRPSGRGLGTRGFAPSHCPVDVPRSHTLPPATGPALSLCSGPAQRLSPGREAHDSLRKGPGGGCRRCVSQRRAGGGGQTEGQTPAEEAKRALATGASERSRTVTETPHASPSPGDAQAI